MHSITPRRVATFLVHLILLVALFLVMVGLLDNKNTMHLTIHTTSGHAISPTFYYTKKGSAFSDSKMSRGYPQENGQYIFQLPPFSEMHFARLDPVQRQEKLFIGKNIDIIISKWFTNYYYTADISNSEPGGQIRDYHVDKQGVTFQTTGNDPYLNINLTRKLSHTSRAYHLDTFLLSSLIYLFLLYLYTLYKSEPLSHFLTAKLILYTLFLAFSLYKVTYYKTHIHYTYPPDTIAHLSYVDSINHHFELLPKFENMYMLTNQNAGNYLGHPPLYYIIMNSVYDSHSPLHENMDRLRTLNIVLFMLSVMLLFYIGFNAKIGILGHFTYLSVLTSIPMHAYLGSSLTNDNLAILGGIIFLIGLQRLLQQKYTTGTYFMIGLGIFVAYFSKLTAALLVFFATIFFLIYLFIKKIPLKINKLQITMLLLFALPIIFYQGYISMHYHTLIPTLNATHPEEYKHSVYFIPEANRTYMNLRQWMENYWNNIHLGWFGIHSHHSFAKLSILQYIGLFVLHLFALLGLFFRCEKEEQSYCLLGKISLLALFAVMFIQVSFSYLSHLHSGYTGGLQVRYLLPFMVAFAIMASIFVNRFSKLFFFAILVIFLCIQAIYSDFFYFLQYYR